MAAREVQIGQRTFQRVEDAWQAVREVLNPPPLGSKLEGDALAFISDLMLLHPNAEEKIGPGIAAITVRAVYQNRGFWITRTDGTEDNFSIDKCLRKPAPPMVVKRLAVHGALRKAITEQLDEVRAQFSVTRWTRGAR
ncbi:MAG: DCL family protein [Pseudonocardiaceae bacterium]